MSAVVVSYEEALDLSVVDVLNAARKRGIPIDHPEDVEVSKFLAGSIYGGYLIELEHGTKYGVDSPANVTNNDPQLTVAIAWAHILEDPLYYWRLDSMEKDGESFLDELRKDGEPKSPLAVLVKKVDSYLEPHRILKSEKEIKSKIAQL